jgi:hypothetical protein
MCLSSYKNFDKNEALIEQNIRNATPPPKKLYSQSENVNKKQISNNKKENYNTIKNVISKTGDVFFSNNKTQEEKDNKLIGRKTKRDDKNVNKIVIDIDPKNILGLGEDLFNFNSIEESYKASRNSDNLNTSKLNNLSKTLNNDSEYSKQKIEDNDTLIEAVEPKIINNEQKQNDILNQKVKVDTSKKMDQNSLNIKINYEEKEQIRKIKYWVIISFINELNSNIKNEKLKIKKLKLDKIDIIEPNKNLEIYFNNWEIILPFISEVTRNDIINILKNEPEAEKLLKITFENYLNIILVKRREKFISAEYYNQEKRYKRRKYNVIIYDMIKSNNLIDLQIIHKYMSFEERYKKCLKNNQFYQNNIIDKYKDLSANEKIKKIKTAIEYFDDIIKTEVPSKQLIAQVLDKIVLTKNKNIEFKLKMNIDELI